MGRLVVDNGGDKSRQWAIGAGVADAIGIQEKRWKGNSPYRS